MTWKTNPLRLGRQEMNDSGFLQYQQGREIPIPGIREGR